MKHIGLVLSGGMGKGAYQIGAWKALKEAGVKKIILALDNDWDEDGNKEYGLNKMIAEAYKIKDYGFDVDIIYDWNGDLLGNKDAPIDKGRQTYSKLSRYCGGMQV